ncbi:MAG: hypothetical protein WCJ84_00405 [Candidatus Peregrinibacteria bacterium]
MNTLLPPAGIKTLGMYTIVECDASSSLAKKMVGRIEMLIAEGREFRKELEKYHAKFAIRKEVVKNIVPDVGFANIAEYCINASPAGSFSPKIAYGAVGTGSSAPASGDTQLGTEVYRATITSQSRVGNVIYNTLFIGLSSANGYTISEFGLFSGSASGTANSGTIFSRILVSPTFSKTSAKTMTIDTSHTFSN